MGEREDYDLIALDLIGNRKGKAIQHGDPTVRAVVPLGHSFRELAAASSVSINTLLSRKHAAVRYLRERMRDVYEELFD